MRKLQTLIVAGLAAIVFTGCASTGKVTKIKETEEKVIDVMLTKPSFHTRKRLTYLIAWNRIPVGKITAESGDIINYKGRDVYTLKVVTESNKFLSKIYRVEDTYTSYVDTQTISSRRYEANRKEGRYDKHVIVEYDFDNMEAIYYSILDGSIKRCSIEENVQDPVSAMCYFMTTPVKLGDELKLTINLNEKNYKMFGKIESVDVVKLRKLGSFPAFKLRPYAELKGERVKKGRAWGYFSADKNRYPIYGVVLIPFGRVTATLVSVEDF
ncbi:DUF3108 domain-containing protein [Candidatus Omnitrophota bacterium]